MFTKNQKGFGAVEALLILVIVGIIGGAGWYVFQSQKKTNQSLDNANKSLTELSQQKNVEQSKDETEYIEIKEWGVRFALNDDYSDMYYLVKPSQDSGYQFAYFSTKSIDIVAPECAVDKTSQLALGRYKKNSTNDKSKYYTETFQSTYLRTIGNYDYTYSLGNGGCAESSITEQKVIPLRRAFVDMVKSLELIPG